MQALGNMQQTSGSAVSRKRGMRCVALWTVQVLLALLFLLAGSMKLITPIEVMMAQMTVPLPGWFVQFIGVAEVAGALGLILPGLLRIQRRLTPLAALGLLIIMLGATVIMVVTMDVASALFPLVVGLFCVVVTSGRRSWGLSRRA